MIGEGIEREMTLREQSLISLGPEDQGPRCPAFKTSRRVHS